MLFDPAGHFVFGPDLGTDKVWSWTLSTAGTLVPNSNLAYDQVASGSGPRHMSFHPSGKFVYVIDEMVSSITAFTYDAARGTFTWLQTVSTLPADFTGTSSTAEIIVHQSGKFVYGSNRGHNSIVGFRIDQTTGKLSLIGWTSTQGEFPRGFNIEPSGRLMLVGNQNTDTIVPFRINQSSGRLHATGAITRTPVPVSIGFGRVTT
jgi:6-phosphogluconolactonase